MFETLSILPLAFWVVLALLMAGVVWAGKRMGDGSGLPILAVLGTVAAWYVGDAFYNDYPNNHVKLFDEGILRSAWWEVAWFLVVFLLATPYLNRWINRRYLRQGSGILHLFRYGTGQPLFQNRLNHLFYGCALIFGALAMIAAVRLKGETLYYLCPYLDHKAEPWGRGRLGSGFDALLTVAMYLHLLVAGTFGVVAAVSTRRTIRFLALVSCLLSWPYFVFGGARNATLAVVIPTILSYVFLRLRGGTLKRVVVLSVCFALVNAWMGFIIANRSQKSIVTALTEEGFDLASSQSIHHEGLNMFEELCWINTFVQQGTYTPNWGQRYFAELINPIPRSLWPGKPMIGIDYAIARGQGADNERQASVYATVSTGMIGQGVVNFGRLFGPVFAALLMSLWVAVLARLDLSIQKLGRMAMYALGLILTFNLGRDITLITLYPFVFGAVLLWFLDRYQPQTQKSSRWRMRPQKPQTILKTGRIGIRSAKRRAIAASSSMQLPTTNQPDGRTGRS